MKNVIYLIEKFGSNQHLSIAEDSLNQAIVNTQVISTNSTILNLRLLHRQCYFSFIVNSLPEITLRGS